MARARRPRVYNKSATQAQLVKDLRGRPIPFRRTPSLPPGKTKGRWYYNPYTGDIRSEDYVMRVYNPAVKQSMAMQSDLNAARKKIARQQREYSASLVDVYAAKQVVLGTPMDRGSIRRDYNFNALVQRLRVVAYEARQVDRNSIQAEYLYAADGEYAQILTALGRRLETDSFEVGMSPQRYIANTVLPTYEEQSGQVVYTTIVSGYDEE